MSEWKVEFYQFPNGSSPVLDWFNEQDGKVRAKLARIFDLLQKEGKEGKVSKKGKKR